tara:strand:- start:122 stop:1231 length:1110 start_codon:yes stop_codon:yes gene_type:complete
MKVSKILVIVLALIFSFESIGQGFYNRYGYRTKRHEINIGGGATSCLTDLGGRDAIGSGFLWDIDIAKTSYIGSFSYIYNALSKFAFRFNLAYLNISGDDRYAGNFHRNNRRLNFETSIIETAAIFELTLITAKTGDRYNLKGPARKFIKARKPTGLGLYIFGGVGGFHFEPYGYDRFTDDKGNVTGSGLKYKLRPLHTEGQGMEGGPEEFSEGKTYSQFAICTPVGFGLKKAFSSSSGLKIEASYRFTNTDYLDDVSTLYYDREKLIQKYGEASGKMSGTSTGIKYTYIGYAIDGNFPIGAIESPEIGGTNSYIMERRYTEAGNQRGNPVNDDGYMYVTLSVYKKFTNHAKSYRPIRRNQKRKVKASF